MDIENVVEIDVSMENDEEDIDVDISEAGPQGLSAYEIYVKNGGSLTEEAWLESLKGQNGITPNITIGNTQTLDAGSNATVAKTGTTLNPVFSFGIPQGIQGEPGEQGPQGIQGPQGPKGETGSSALNYTIVQELPTEDIQESTLYFVPNSTPEEENLYDEYAYINNKWEKLGSKKIDLSDYYKKTEVDNLIPTVPTNLSSFTDDLGNSPTHTHSQYLTEHQDISGKENSTNKVTSISNSSTDTQYPSAKCVYEAINNAIGSALGGSY
jgi:hypothetical protein